MDSRTINSSTTSFTYAGDLMDTASGGEGFELDWDDNGNMTTGVSQTITYNWDNKLRTATKGTKTISLRYDPGGNRIRKQSIDGAEETTHKYIVDIVGDLPTTLMEMTDTDNTILKTYIYANGQVLCQNDGDYSAPRYFYIHDRLGSVRQIINTSGNVVRYYTYEPFGEVLEEGGTLSNYMMFTGQYFDTEIDQYYLRARQYDPHISRFTARDPIRGKFEEPMTLHVYLYCLNDPINKIDPLGEWAFVIGLSGSFNFTLSDIGMSRVGTAVGTAGAKYVAPSLLEHYMLLLPYYILLTKHYGAGVTGGIGLAVAKDSEQPWNKGWSIGPIGWVGGGVSISTGWGASVMLDIAISPQAQSREDLLGYWMEFGGSVTTSIPGPFGFWTGGFTVSRGVKPVGGFNDIYLYTGSIGLGTPGSPVLAGWGGEAHAYVGHTWPLGPVWFEN